jgi:hypothetical protein
MMAMVGAGTGRRDDFSLFLGVGASVLPRLPSDPSVW